LASHKLRRVQMSRCLLESWRLPLEGFVSPSSTRGCLASASDRCPFSNSRRNSSTPSDSFRIAYRHDWASNGVIFFGAGGVCIKARKSEPSNGLLPLSRYCVDQRRRWIGSEGLPSRLKHPRCGRTFTASGLVAPQSVRSFASADDAGTHQPANPSLRAKIRR